MTQQETTALLRMEAVRAALADNPRAKIREISQLTGISQTAVCRYIKKLRGEAKAKTSTPKVSNFSLFFARISISGSINVVIARIFSF